MILNKRVFQVFASLVFVIVGMGICGSTAASQDPAQANTPPKPKAPKLLPDIMAQSPHISLISTDLGKPGAEFPNDRVRFTAIIKNGGRGSCPVGGSYHIQLWRNGELLSSSTATDLLSAAGSTYNYSYPDSFFHERWSQISYKIKVTPNFNEADTQNNSAEAMVEEAMLHGSGTPDFGITDLTASFVDGPAGRTYYFVVTVKNNSSTYATIGTRATLYINQVGTLRDIALQDVSDRKLPTPGSHLKYNLSVTAAKMPAGTYSVRAKIDYPNDQNKSNDVSGQTPLIKNTP
jgi:hypothetical protein